MMIRQYRRVRSFNTETYNTTYFVEVSIQPFHNWLIHKLYHAWERSTGWVETPANAVASWWHSHHCNGDCDTFIEIDQFGNEEEFELGCGRLPTGVTRDLQCFDLSEKNDIIVARTMVSSVLYELVK